MCGHLGVAGSLGGPEKSAFKQMLQVGSLRGPHSVGAYFKARNEEVGSVFHALGHGHELTEFKQFDTDLAKAHNVSVMLGHNRWATQGGVNIENAHPFSYGDIIGAHNGTVPEYGWKKLEYGGKEDMDSKALLKSISEVGAKETIAQISYGAWCLIWYDEVYNTINFLRNEERDLYLCTSGGGKNLWWASELGMLVWILGRNGIKIDPGSILQLPINKHMALEIPKLDQKFWLPYVEDAPKKSFFTSSGRANATDDYDDWARYRGKSWRYSSGDSKFTYHSGEVVSWDDLDDSYDTHGSCCQNCGTEIPKYSASGKDGKIFFHNGVTAPMFVCDDCWKESPPTWKEWLIENLGTDSWALRSKAS